jgi:hypothetical protein
MLLIILGKHCNHTSESEYYQLLGYPCSVVTALNTEVAGSSGTYVLIYDTKWHHICRDSNFY